MVYSFLMENIANVTGHVCAFPVAKGVVSMKSISQVARLADISVRALQYYDETERTHRIWLSNV